MADYFGPGTELVGGWAGLYAVTPDHHPVVEETRPGFVNAVGFSGHGFMQSPATGKVVAELVLDGEPRTVDVAPLRADRFERGEELYEGSVID
jgi:sarcosine oxidase subunit beta